MRGIYRGCFGDFGYWRRRIGRYYRKTGLGAKIGLDAAAALLKRFDLGMLLLVRKCKRVGVFWASKVLVCACGALSGEAWEEGGRERERESGDARRK